MRQWGECSFSRDALPKASENCRRRSTCKPGDLETLRLLGIMQGQSGQLDAAVKTFRRAIELYPKSSRDHYLLGRALAAMGQIAAAVPYFARAVVLDPQNAEAREDLRRAERDATAAAEVRR